MCGITGSVLPHRTAQRHVGDEHFALRCRMDWLEHRGPDGASLDGCPLPWAQVLIGAVRLAIVGGKDVPVLLHEGGCTLAYNGEIYNWRQLREELGGSWETECDGEVLLRAWRAWGPAMLGRLNGMFAFCIVDQRGEVFLARDRAGEKPLYWTVAGGALHFASEAKALAIRLEPARCPELDALEADCTELTPFRGVFMLAPGHYLHFKDAGDALAPKPCRWWFLQGDTREDATLDELADELQALLVDAVRIRASADVKVALLLSGGLDSAIIQAIAPQDALYCCTFPQDGVDNLTAARLAAPGREVTPVTFGFDQMMSDFRAIAWHLDTPATWSAVCDWFLMQQVAQDGAKIVLSGEGADELFLGYTRYRALWWQSRAASDPLLQGYQPTRELLQGGTDEDTLVRLLDRSGGTHSDVVRCLVRRFGPPLLPDLAAAAGRIEWSTTMQVLLRMADRMAMAWSVENRSPFLDYRVAEWAARCPTSAKITLKSSKTILRVVAKRLGVHESIINERTKKGLFIPWQKWLGRDAAAQSSPRGPWDRRSFAALARSTWEAAFFGGTLARQPGPLASPEA